MYKGINVITNKDLGFKLMNSTSFGDFMTAGGFIQKTAPETTVIHSKQEN